MSTSTTTNTPYDPDQEDHRIVLILVGLIGSGKSTFAEALQEHFPRFRRCNQDDLGNRRLVEDLARQSLEQGLSVCVDRTNFNAAQRKIWIDIAREFRGTQIWVIVFNTPYEECAARLQRRVSHPTIKTPEQGLSVLARFASDFRMPLADEGFDRLISLDSKDYPTPVYSRSDVAAVLQRTRESLPALHPSIRAKMPGWMAYSANSHRGFTRGQFSTLNTYRGRYSSTGAQGSRSHHGPHHGPPRQWQGAHRKDDPSWRPARYDPYSVD